MLVVPSLWPLCPEFFEATKDTANHDGHDGLIQSYYHERTRLTPLYQIRNRSFSPQKLCVHRARRCGRCVQNFRDIKDTKNHDGHDALHNKAIMNEPDSRPYGKFETGHFRHKNLVFIVPSLWPLCPEFLRPRRAPQSQRAS